MNIYAVYLFTVLVLFLFFSKFQAIALSPAMWFIMENVLSLLIYSMEWAKVHEFRS